MKFMKHFFILMAGAFLSVCLASCSLSFNKNGGVKAENVVQKKLVPGKFVSVCNSSICDVQFVQSDSTYVLLRGDKDVLKYVHFECKDNELLVTTDDKPMFDNKISKVLVVVSSPDLISLESSGTGDIFLNGNLDTDRLHVSLNGTGDVNFSDVVCDTMDVEINGTGDFSAKRVEAISFTANTTGTGDMSVLLRNVEESSFRSVGTGDMDVKFDSCGKSSYILSGTGDITLSGDLHQLTELASGSGDVDKDGLKVK